MNTNDTERCVLESVPRVGYYDIMLKAGINRCPEDMAFPACLRAVLDYVGEACLGCRNQPTGQGTPVTQCGYGFLMGLAGNAFAASWNPQRWEWWNGNVLRATGDALAPVRWVLEDLGYTYEILGNRDLDRESLFATHADEQTVRARLITSIQAGRPAIGFGVVGPPEACVITGYDEGGEILTGWSFFQEFPEHSQGLTFEPSGYFRKRDWFRNTLGVVLIGPKTASPDWKEAYRRSLECGLDIMRTPRVRGTYASGVAAFEAWIDTLLRDAEFVGQEKRVLNERHQIHNDMTGAIAELRAYGAGFLRDVADALPEAADELRLAAGCFSAEHDLMWCVWKCTLDNITVPDWPEDEDQRFARRDCRERIVEILRRAEARDREAAEHLEKVLALLDQAGERPENRIAPRTVLENVPYVGFSSARTGDWPECTPVCTAIKSALAYVGEPYSYLFLMGVSGAAFRLAWNAERWDGGNISTLCMGEDPTEHFRRAFWSVGWEPKVLGNAAWRNVDPSQPAANIYIGPDYLGDNVKYVDETTMRHVIVESLRYLRYPVLSIGTILPPEFGLLTGYDEGGNVLIGWNHFQDWPESRESGKVSYELSGYYRKRDWFVDTCGIVALHYKTPRPGARDKYTRALQWAVLLGRTPRFRQYHSGLAAYEAWATALGRDGEFAAADEQGLGLRLMCHDDAITCIGEGRTVAAVFVREAALALPDAAPSLEEAARCYEAECEVVQRMVDVLGEFEPEKAHKLARPETRKQLVALILEARGHDERAIEHLERAIASK